MAATVTNTALVNTSRRLVIRSHYVADAVASTDVVLVDKSTFVGPDGTEPGRFVIEKIEWAIDGLTAVNLEIDHTADTPIVILGGGSGEIDFTNDGEFQGFVESSAGDLTGDIVITTAGDAAGDSATFVFYLRKKD
jgi:hypothetical protein